MAYDDLAPTYAVEIADSELGTAITQFVERVEYESCDGLADEARLTINDPNFEISKLKVFRAGNEMNIFMGYGAGELKPIGRVILRRVNHNFPRDGMPSFTVSGYTLDAKMMDNSPEEGARRGFKDEKLSGIVTKITGDESPYGFVTQDIDETPDEPDETKGKFQKAGVTDFQMVQACANLSGFIWWVDYDFDAGGWAIHFKDPANVVTADEKTFEYHNDDLTSLLEFQPELLLQGVTTKMKVAFKDPKTGKRIVEEIEEESEAPDTLATGDETEESEDEVGTPTEIKVVLGDFSFDLQPKRFRTAAEAKAWVEQWFRRNKENFVTAQGVIIGDPDIMARQIHTLTGISPHLEGKYYFSKVRHVMSVDAGYECTFHCRKQDSLTL